MEAIKILFFLLFNYSVFACNLSMQQININYTYQDNELWIFTDLHVKNNTEQACPNYIISFASNSGTTYLRTAKYLDKSVNYNIYSKNDFQYILKEAGNSSPNEYLQGSFNAGEKENIHRIFFRYEGPVPTYYGNYSDTVTAYITTDAKEFLSSAIAVLNFNVNIDIPIEVQLKVLEKGENFKSGSGGIKKNLGNLDSEKVVEADMVVKSNVPYSVECYSLNGGSMHSPYGANMPYNFFINNQKISLENSANSPIVFSTLEAANLDGQTYSLKVVVPEANRILPEGEYTDSIIFSAQAEL